MLHFEIYVLFLGVQIFDFSAQKSEDHIALRPAKFLLRYFSITCWIALLRQLLHQNRRDIIALRCMLKFIPVIA